MRNPAGETMAQIVASISRVTKAPASRAPAGAPAPAQAVAGASDEWQSF
jgi:hypothetical protein